MSGILSCPPDVFVLFARYLDVRSSLRLSVSCSGIAARTRGRVAWWMAVLEQLLTKELDLLPENVVEMREKLSLLPPQTAVRAVYSNPPQYVCLLAFNPDVPRDKAVDAIQKATNCSSLTSLWKALNVGHPALRPAADEFGVVRGEIMRGSRREVQECIERLSLANSQLGAKCQWLGYEASPLFDEQDDATCAVS